MSVCGYDGTDIECLAIPALGQATVDQNAERGAMDDVAATERGFQAYILAATGGTAS